MKILNYALILCFSLTLLSCSSSSSSSDDTAPVLEFINPSTDSENPTTITSGQTVTFTGKVSDDKEMKSITFTNLGEKTKTVNQFVSDFNEKLNAAKPKSTSVLDKETYNVNFDIETLAGAPTSSYTMTCKVIDGSDNPKEVTFYINVE